MPRVLRDCGGYRTGFVGKYHLFPSGVEGAYATLADAAGRALRRKERPRTSRFDSKRENESDSRQGAGTTRTETSVSGALGVDFVGGFYASNLPGPKDGATEDGSFETHNPEWVVDEGLAFLNGSAPFYLSFNPTLVHTPSVAALLDPAHEARGVGFNVATSTPAGFLAAPPDPGRFCAGCGMPPRAEVWAAMEASGVLVRFATGRVAYEEAQLAAAVVWLDRTVGSLLAFLDATRRDDVYTLFTSDHGAFKDSLRDVGTRTFLVVRGPGVPAGGTRADLVSQTDYGPTLLDLAGLGAAAYDADGASFARALRSGDDDGPDASGLGDRAAFAEAGEDRAVYLRTAGGAFWKAIRAPPGATATATCDDGRDNAPWCAYYPSRAPLQVYDLVTDPAEQADVAATADAATVARLVALLDAHDARDATPAAAAACATAPPTPRAPAATAPPTRTPREGPDAADAALAARPAALATAAALLAWGS